MLVVGMVEKRDVANEYPNPLGISSMLVMWLAPQLILMGFFEAFTIIGQIEFFNSEFPDHMKSIANSLLSCSNGVASLVTAFMVTFVHHTTRTDGNPDWLTHNMNKGRLDYFYYLIAMIAALNTACFLFVARRYRYKPITNGDFAHDCDGDVELASQNG